MNLSNSKKPISLKKQANLLLVIPLLIFAWIIFGFNTSNIDYSNYEAAYNNFYKGIDDGYLEFGFVLIIKVFVLLRFSYQSFLIALSLITLIIFINAIKYFTNNQALAFCFYLIYPFAFDVVQYRNFLAFAIVLYALHFLIKKNVRKRDICAYVALLLVASGIHLSMVIYASFLLVLIKRVKVLTIISAITFAMILVFVAIKPLQKFVLDLLGLDRFMGYDDAISFSTFVQYLLIYVFWLALAVFKYYYIDDIPRHSRRLKRNLKETSQLKLLIICALLLPFIIMNGTSARFIRNVFILFYCYFVNRSNYKLLPKQSEAKTATIYRYTLKNDKLLHYAVLTVILASVLFVFSEQLCSGLYYSGVLEPILKNNLLW